MARQSSEKAAEIQRLIELGASSRSHLEGRVSALKNRLDVPARLHHSVKEHSSTWMWGALLSGVAASFLFRSRRRRPKKGEPVYFADMPERKGKGIRGMLFALIVAAVRPLVKDWLLDQAKQKLLGRHSLPSSPISGLLSRFSHKF